MKENINFIAIDFETTDKYSACQLGIVIVRKGEITEEKQFLIQPPNNYYTPNSIKIHGITPEMTKDSPTFAQLWESIKCYFEHQVIIFHGNNNDFDLLVLSEELNRNNLKMLSPLAIRNTYTCFDESYQSKSLGYLCKAYNIDMEQHHDALSDARCCALLFMKYLLNEKADLSIDPEIFKRKRQNKFTEDPERKIASDTKVQNLSIVINKETIFYDKKVVISGVFERYSVRNDLGLFLKNLGADINSAISAKTDIFIVGKDCGPKKIEKVMELKDQGNSIQIIEEKDLYKIIDSIG